MQPQPPSQNNYSDLQLAINPMVRQLDRLEERTRDLATRADLEALRKELVARDSLEPQLNALKFQINRVDEDRLADKRAGEKRMDDLESEQISKQDRLWIRLGQIMAIAAFALALFEFIARFRITP